MIEPAATPREAIQYWYDAATERREERDRLRAVVARLSQMADYWEQQLPEVIRTPAVVSAIRAALEPAATPVLPPADRAAAYAQGIRAAITELKRDALGVLPRLEAMAAETQPITRPEADDYERTTGHLITCLAVAGGGAAPDCPCAAGARQDGEDQ